MMMKRPTTANCCKKDVHPTPTTYFEKAKNAKNYCGFLKLGYTGVFADNSNVFAEPY